MATENDIKLIEKYLFGKLSEQENIAFKQRIETDKEFAEEVTFMQDLKLSSKVVGREQLKTKLKSIGASYKENESKYKVANYAFKEDTGEYNVSNPTYKENELKPKFSLKTYFAIAASVLIIAGASALFYLIPLKNGNDTNNLAGLQSDTTIKEVNKIINNSSSNTNYFNIEQVDDGYGYAETDSTANNKLPVLIVHSAKFTNHYLFRDTLFLFLKSEDDLRFFSFSQYPNFLYFSQKGELPYYLELKKAGKINPIKEVVDKEMVSRIREIGKK